MGYLVEASLQTDTTHGPTCSTAGDVNGDGYSDILIGAPHADNVEIDEGIVILRMGSASGVPSLACTLEINLNSANFGTSLAAGDVNGDGYDDVLVGAPNYSGGQSAEGAAFLYLGSAAGLSCTPIWTVESNQADAHLGTAVAIPGDVTGDGLADAMVGIPDWDNGHPDEGKFELYLGIVGGLTPAPVDRVEGNASMRGLGATLAGAGDLNGDGLADLLVGAPFDRSGPLNGQGRVYVYLSAGATLGAPALTLEGTEVDENLGSISTAGDTDGDGYCDFIVGSPRFGGTDAGKAALYRGGPALSAVPAWTYLNPNASDRAGMTVSTGGDLDGDGYADVLVGAPYADNGLFVDNGAVKIFQGSVTGLSSLPIQTIFGEGGTYRLGIGLCTAGDINGDGLSDVVMTTGLANFPIGGAYTYTGLGDAISSASSWTEQSNAVSAKLGKSAALGDVNGDGFDDIIVGGDTWDNVQNDEGRIQVFYGTWGPPSGTPGWEYEPNVALARVGASVAAAGDVNGDGYVDIIVGAPGYSNGQPYQGRVMVFHGSPTGPSATPNWFVESSQLSAAVGISVAAAGDVNGDGYGDVIIGIPNWTGDFAWEGRAEVYLGGPAGLAATPAWNFEANISTAFAGTAVGSAGDVNADGFSDVLVGAPNYTNTLSVQGRIHVFLGSASGLSPAPFWTADGDIAFAELGASASTAGDYNGDGFSDIVVGAAGQSQIRLYWGSAVGLTFKGFTPVTSGSGRVVSPAGDLDGDGLSDFVVGAPEYANGQAFEGAVRVAFGRLGLGTTIPTTLIESNQANVKYGTSVAGAGDANGDGFADLLVGAPNYTSGQADEGICYLYFGNGQLSGMDRRLQQFRVNSSAPIGPLGLSDDSGSLRVKLRGRSAEGRATRLRFEWQMVSVQALLKNDVIQTDGMIHDTGVPINSTVGSYVDLSKVIGTEPPSAPTHWRVRTTSRNPYFPHSHWFSPAWSGTNETDLRLSMAPSAVGEAPPARSGPQLLAWPNPFQGTTRVSLDLPKAVEVDIAVFDPLGRRVASLGRAHYPAGPHEWTWDGRDTAGRRLAAGTYFVRARYGEEVVATRVILTR